MRKRTSYDTTIKHLYREGLEEMIPKSIRREIPRSTIHRWRNEKRAKYIGKELNKLTNAEMDHLRRFMESKKDQRSFISMIRVIRFMQEIAGDELMKKKLKTNKEEVIDLIEHVKDSMPLDQVLRCFNITRTTYNTWIMNLYGNCNLSELNWCKVKQPQQLSNAEVNTMRELLTHPDFSHWPISSVAHYARREGLMYASNSTWYKYSKLLKLRKQDKQLRKKPKRQGIKANEPNEIWHADVTYFRVGVKMYYIYLVIDNFSRKILNFMVSDKLSAKNRLQTIKDAYTDEFGLLYPNLMLLVDGGSENNNHTMDDFVDLLPNLTKFVALRDIQFGNVQIESHNKILKQSWLYRKKIVDGHQLKREVANAIHEFNMKRPYDALGGMTPSEVHEGVDNYMDWRRQTLMREARMQRCSSNQCTTCEHCPFKPKESVFEEAFSK